MNPRGASLENYINKHGKEEGEKRWEEYKRKRKETYAKNKQKNPNRYNWNTLEHSIKKHGKKNGKKLWEERIEKTRKSNTKQALIEKFGIEHAEIIAKNRWNNLSLERFIGIYGEIDGPRRYAQAIQNIKNSMSLDGLIKKHGKELGEEIFQARTWKRNKSSKIANSFFNDLYKLMKCDKTFRRINDIEFGATEKPVFLKENERKILNQKMIFPDFKYGNCIIEFYGDLWHMNPKIVKEHDIHPFNKLKAADIRNRDKIREKILKRRGFKLLVIWENNVKLNKNIELNRCLTFLRKYKNDTE